MGVLTFHKKSPVPENLTVRRGATPGATMVKLLIGRGWPVSHVFQKHLNSCLEQRPM